MERQTRTNWCWAATAKSVSIFYDAGSTWSQCKIASSELGTDCCGAYSDQACNRTWFLNRALQRTSNYDATQSCVSPASPCGVLNFDIVVSEIKKGHPVGIRIGWEGGGGHFIVIYGYRDDASGRYYYVDDPINGRSPPLAEADLQGNYQYTGHWTHSYYTRPEPGPVVSSNWPVAKDVSTSAVQLDLSKMQPTRIGFKLAPVDEGYAALADRARPFLDSERSTTRSAEGKQFTLAVPHDVYVAGLTQLATSPDPLPDKSSGTRVLEMADGNLFAAYDVKKSEGKPPALISGKSSAAFIGALSNGLQNATRLSERTSEAPELRLLSVPALYFEALWLHYANAAEDTFVPILSQEIPLNQPIGKSALLAALRELAQKRVQSDGPDQRQSAP
jgi:hypothetical protein